MFGAVRDVLRKTGLSPDQIGVLVVNCSLFNPTPSLAACALLATHHAAVVQLRRLGRDHEGGARVQDDHPRVWHAPGHLPLQPRGHGLLRGPHRRGPRGQDAADLPEPVRARGEHGERDAELVLWQPAQHAAAQLPLPHGRLRRGAVQPLRRRLARQVPAALPHRAHDDRRQERRRVPLHLPDGGRRRQRRARSRLSRGSSVLVLPCAQAAECGGAARRASSSHGSSWARRGAR